MCQMAKPQDCESDNGDFIAEHNIAPHADRPLNVGQLTR